MSDANNKKNITVTPQSRPGAQEILELNKKILTLEAKIKALEERIKALEG